MADADLRALASLLESEGPENVALMVEHIRSLPEPQFRSLTDVVPPGSRADEQINLVLAEREAPRTQAALLQWLDRGADLEQGVLLVARTGYPRLDTDAVRKQLDELASSIAAEIGSADSEALRTLTRILRDRYGFHGNESDYDDPDNSYLNRVLERRTGLPISLAVLYILLGQRLGLTISGVALPGHFIASLATSTTTIFFDPFRGGRILTMREVMSLVSGTGHLFHPTHLRPAGPRQIVQRMLANLVRAYGVREDLERAELARQYLAVL